MDTETELWQPIPGWEGYYSASDHGHIRSEERTVPTANGQLRTYRSKILSHAVEADTGRCMVQLHRDGRSHPRRVHQLVMLAFVGPCPDGMEVCHWDDDAGNNRLTNLRYDTSAAKSQDMARNGNGNQNWQKTHCVRGHEFTPENTYQRPNGGRDCRTCWSLRDSAYTPKGTGNRDKTHCIRGHEFTPENTYQYAKGRQCRACAIDRGRSKRQNAS